jgi:hypothetical protein
VPAAAGAPALGAGAADEEVGIAAPAVGEQASLVDDGGASGHGGQRAYRALGVGAVELDDLGVPLALARQVALLVLLPLPGRQREFLVAFVRGHPLELGRPGTASPLALGGHPLAPGGEVALEVRGQVMRRVPEGPVRERDHA